MSRLPRIAIFKPEAKISDEVSSLFLRHEYLLTNVESVNQLHQIITQDPQKIDIIIMPIQLLDGSSGITTCLNIKEDQELAHIPIIGLSFTSEKQVVQAFYEMGADVVVISPFDSELFYFQAQALCRVSTGNSDHDTTQEVGAGHSPEDPLTSAFHSFRDGFLLFDRNMQLTFGNTSARVLLGIPESSNEQHIKMIEQCFRPWLQQHLHRTESIKSSSGKLYEEASEFESEITHLGGQKFSAVIRVAALFKTTQKSHEVVGFAASFYHLGELHQLSNILDQSERTRSLCLIATASSLQYLEPTQSGIVVSPLLRIEEQFDKAPRECSLTPALTTLLEFLDLVISPGVSVKVKMKSDVVILLRRSDLFQLLGHMILHAVTFAGTSGETVVDVGDTVPGEGVTVMISSRAKEVVPHLPGSRLSDLLHNHLSATAKDSTHRDKLQEGLSAARQIAKTYRTEIEYSSSESNELKLRVRLPARFNVAHS